MAQCNRCGATLSRTTRALKVHRRHCPKKVSMRFKEPASRAPKPIKDASVEPISDLEQEQEQEYGIQVIFVFYLLYKEISSSSSRY